MEDDRLWKFRKPAWLNSAWARNIGVYAAGALFSLAFYVLIDSAVWSKSRLNGSDVHVNFVDWLPFIFSSLGMLIINSVEKSRLSSDSFSYSGSGVAWKARVVLFLGFAALAGGMAGGVVVFVLKFAVPQVGWPMMGMGVENVVANALVGLSTVVLWVSQNMEDEYSYNLSL
ncbi:vacuolar protein sorting-associated protein [Xylariomycetidae sp. FL2044]|nr:vacuolar protein sorting-associated protein [Xylariomycetidae sp. FL2044]